MARPKNQTARREELINTAMQAGADVGLHSLSLTEIAKRAGLTRGAVLYYYDDLDALIIEVHQAGVERLSTERDRQVSAISDPRGKLWAAIVSGLPTSSDDPLMRMLYQFDSFAAQSPAHARLLIDLNDHQLKTYASVIELGRASGLFNPRLPTDLLARTLVALEDAYGLYITTGGDQVMTTESARDSMVSIAADLGLPAQPHLD